MKTRIILIDNFDSFTYNLADEFKKRDIDVITYRNNVDIDLIEKAIDKFDAKLIVLSPGPGNPKSAGITIPLIKKHHMQIPIFGVCLGHQAIAEAFGGKINRAEDIVHGKSSVISHDGKTIFQDVENPMQVGRYHSLCASDLPECLEVTAKTTNGVVMGIRYKKKGCIVEGLQFHPESILTPGGGKIIENLIRIIR
ncbi:MAG: aminodeoxychorismate/anthranilate synthase component II [Candidatus Aenigmarchaeota archaeon]|nr:aminodeoxychorismate/anthranilate synthase component II [Candidatus Aenigmarchaeota archaeon]